MLVDNLEVVTTGRVLAVASLRNEWYDLVEHPEDFIPKLREAGCDADVFTFLQPIPYREPQYSYARDVESIAVLPVTTFDHWWKTQISDKTRNMIRKAGKKALTIRVTQFDDKFLA